MHYRPTLLSDGVELYETRARPDSSRGSGQSQRLSRYGNYALHAKLIVLDRRRLFIGLMNLDQRSRYLNTEIGLIIDSAPLSLETAKRFEAIDSAAEFVLRVGLRLRAFDPLGLAHRRERQPAVNKNPWRRIEVRLLALLPLDSEL